MIFTVFQLTLGALTIITRRDVLINSLHVVCGALVLATSLVLTLRTWHVRIADCRMPIADSNATADPRSPLLHAIRNGGRA